MKVTAVAAPENSQLTYRQMRCKICYGTGRDTTNSPMGVRCKRCEGKGWRFFPDGPAQKYPSCLGRGKDYRFSRAGMVCQECDGFGEIKLL